jgi:protein TonB
LASVPSLLTAGPAPRIGGPRVRRGSDRVLGIALGVSLALHAIVLSLRFTFPEAFKSNSAPPLEVVLVNSKSQTRPDRPDVLAQTNLDGGGNTDDNRRAKTPLPAMPRNDPGSDAAARARARVQELEQQQQQLLTRLQQNEAKINVPPTPAKPPPKEAEPTPEPPAPVEVTGQDLAARALAMARLEAQIARQIEEYNKRPRKQFIGARAAEVRFAQYVEDWRQKIERVGNLNYPSDARGRIYGSLRVTVSIKSDGSVESIEIDRPSGYQVLDRAAEKIVRLASPYAPFPADIKKDTDILVITRTWIFAPGDKLQSE